MSILSTTSKNTGLRYSRFFLCDCRKIFLFGISVDYSVHQTTEDKQIVTKKEDVKIPKPDQPLITTTKSSTMSQKDDKSDNEEEEIELQEVCLNKILPKKFKILEISQRFALGFVFVFQKN